jgi:hypothetical protein
LVVAVEEMAMVGLMRGRREDGWSFAMIADAFNGDHVPGKNGGRWYGRTVKTGEVGRETQPQKAKAAGVPKHPRRSLFGCGF